MNIQAINEHFTNREWTAMLNELSAGETHTLHFTNVDDIRSCKAIGYALNSDRKGRKYTFSVDKQTLVVSINVQEDGNAI